MSPREDVRNGSTPTVLLVHGAFADGSIWAEVIAELQDAGIAVMAPANPLRGLAADAAYIASTAAAIDGPVLLAGHSYGGAVISAAGSAAGNVVGLAFVTALALDEDESALDISGRFAAGQLMAALRPASFPDISGDPGAELYLDRESFPQLFAADLPHRTAAAMAAAHTVQIHASHAITLSQPAAVALQIAAAARHLSPRSPSHLS